MPNSRLEIVGDEFLTSIDYDDEFHMNLLFDALFIDRCAHIWVKTILLQAFAPLALGMLISTTYITVMFDG